MRATAIARVELLSHLLGKYLDMFDYLFEMSHLPETYLIGIVLSVITLLLWCLLNLKNRSKRGSEQSPSPTPLISSQPPPPPPRINSQQQLLQSAHASQSATQFDDKSLQHQHQQQQQQQHQHHQQPRQQRSSTSQRQHTLLSSSSSWFNELKSRSGKYAVFGNKNNNNNTNSSSNNKKNDNDNNASNNEDGYLSDSALSFFNSLNLNAMMNVAAGRRDAGPRFRKREKLFFYGKKMIRTVSTVKGSISAESAEKSAKNIYRILSKKILNTKDERDGEQQASLMYRRPGPPQFLLDDPSDKDQRNNHDLPSALINLIRSVK